MGFDTLEINLVFDLISRTGPFFFVFFLCKSRELLNFQTFFMVPRSYNITDCLVGWAEKWKNDILKLALTTFSQLPISLLAHAEAAYYAQLFILHQLELRKTFPGGWRWGLVVGSAENKATSAPIELGLGLSLAKYDLPPSYKKSTF